jgi:hypothetical protein
MKTILRVVLLLCIVWPARGDSPNREAGAHFQRGVELYNDGDFRGALVEFKRAYAIWPRANVLYDIGQTEFQLLDYAAALKTMERYLAETGANAAHRAEVEGTVEVLRGRVGRLAVSADAEGCDVLVDDQPAGTTPASVLVSVGPRKVAVTCNGRPPAVRTVEVTAGEVTRVDLRGLRAPSTLPALRASVPPPKEPEPHRMTKAGLAACWSVTALVGAATVATGASTLVQQSRLQQLKTSFPVTSDQLDKQAQLVLGLSIASDVLGAATLAMAGVSTWATLRFEKDRKLRIGLAGSQLMLKATF